MLHVAVVRLGLFLYRCNGEEFQFLLVRVLLIVFLRLRDVCLCWSKDVSLGHKEIEKASVNFAHSS